MRALLLLVDGNFPRRFTGGRYIPLAIMENLLECSAVTREEDTRRRRAMVGKGGRCATPCLSGNGGTPACRHAYRLRVLQMAES